MGDDASYRCDSVPALAWERAAITARASLTRELKASLEQVARHPDGEHVLYRCLVCGQHWQSARAHNFGAVEYLFRVPEITESAWLDEPYVDPDALMMFEASAGAKIRQMSTEPKGKPCRRPGCDRRSKPLSVFCLLHHVEALQRKGMIAAFPSGRRFGRYEGFTDDAFIEFIRTLESSGE